jgi:hypothetical protein
MGVAVLFVVMPDVTKDFSSEIIEGGKNASSDDLPLNFGKPDFDLVRRTFSQPVKRGKPARKRSRETRLPRFS